MTAPRRLRKRAGWSALPLLVVCALMIGLSTSANAVHDVGVFQLDGNASTATQSNPPAAEDWDLICKANQPSSTPPGPCQFAPGYTQPSGTTTASPNSFVVDPSESATDDILKAGTKDDNDINTWKWASAKPSPPKNDITHGFAAEYECNTAACATQGITGHNMLYFGGDRFSNSGSANLAFWFFQHKVTETADGPNGTCVTSSGCPFAGTHVVGDVSLGGNTPGDILIISAFGPKAAISVYEWVGPGNATSPCFTNACSLQPLLVGSAACDPATTGDPACAVVNDTVQPSPWLLKQKNAPDNAFQPTNFFEGGIDLTRLKVDACFSSFLLNTRASAAGDAELHDKVIGQFARCAPSLTTQASTNGTVQPGTAVHDTATITVTGAANPADPTGDVTFFLCGPDASAPPDCSSGGTNVGTGTLDGGANTTDGIATADSPDVNTGNGLANGFYCFRAEWPGDSNYPGSLSATDITTECFRVLQLSTATVTSPQSPGGTDISGPIALNTQVVDHAVVTGDTAGGTPTGTVTFWICNPTQVTGTGSSAHCADGDGTQVGNPVTATAISGSSPPKSQATSSPAVTANQLGVWCFRATYTPDTPVYTGSSDSTNGECFTVRTTSAASSTQDWLPNDHATISTTGSVPLDGTLSITLRSGSCTGTVVYTEPTNQTLSNVASGTTFDTTNSTFKVDVNNAGTYFWRIVYTPSSSFVDGVTKCETSTVTINNNP